MTEPAIDATADELPVTNEDVERMTKELAPRPTDTRLAVAPQADAGELVQRLDVIKQAMEQAMTPDVDYGKIPGVNKPTLLKPGAEKLGVLFRLDVQLDNAKEWGPGDHLTVESRATVFDAQTGARVGFGEGLCTTREKKYAKRKQERVCPDCGEPQVRQSKHPDKNTGDKGWYCWKKQGGCGSQFPSGDDRITSQEVGEIENPDLPDSWNTVIKMAEKRARVDAILAVTGASALFTQDAEDMATADAKRQHSDLTAGKPHGPDATDLPAASTALVALIGDQGKASATWGAIKSALFGYMPEAAAVALIAAAAALDPTA